MSIFHSLRSSLQSFFTPTHELPRGAFDMAGAGRLSEALAVFDKDPYMYVADEALRLLTVFDDVRYDRSDMDVLSTAMRQHAAKQLLALGFTQRAGSMFEHPCGVRVLMPKIHALGASPFDIARYTPKHAMDYYLLTPTQAACLLIDHYPKLDAMERVKELIKKHPVNLLRLSDYLERKPEHQDFYDTIGHLRYVQREAVTSEPLNRRKALGSLSL